MALARSVLAWDRIIGVMVKHRIYVIGAILLEGAEEMV